MAIANDAVLDVNDLIAALTGGANVIVSTGTAGRKLATLPFKQRWISTGTGSNTLT
ncbi:MAG: hypothetical protein HC840_30040, partial [Leptolyngbyaceae cyanobacterium RM2_2_4]|nr:hypothetical protein [Leptolyngbyaceae cyanobacterium RM2_2_4]